MNIQAALEAPRFTKPTFSGCDVLMENRFSAAARDELSRNGHKIQLLGTYSSAVGGGQAVVRDFAAGGEFWGPEASEKQHGGGGLPDLGRNTRHLGEEEICKKFPFG